MMRKKALIVATVAQSLVHQMPGAWTVLDELGFSLTFAARPDGFESQLNHDHHFIPLEIQRDLRPGGLLKSLRTIDTLLAQEWNLVQLQTPIAGVLGRSARRPACPLLYVAHGFHFHKDGNMLSNLTFRSIERGLSRRTDAIAVVSAEDQEATRRWHTRGGRNVFHLPGAGIDVNAFKGVQRQGKINHLRLLFVGELNNNKDPLFAVSIAESLVRQGLSVSLTVVGNGPLSSVVRTRLEQSIGLQHELIPYSSGIHHLMAKSDVLLAPSKREGLPRVIVEALANGLPIVARSNRGSRELLKGGLGVVMPTTATSDEWTRATLDVVAQPPAFAAMWSRAEAYGDDAFQRAYRILILDITKSTPD